MALLWKKDKQVKLIVYFSEPWVYLSNNIIVNLFQSCKTVKFIHVRDKSDYFHSPVC